MLNFDRSTVKNGTQNILNDCHQWPVAMGGTRIFDVGGQQGGKTEGMGVQKKISVFLCVIDKRNSVHMLPCLLAMQLQ